MAIANDFADIAKALRAINPSGMLFADAPEVDGDYCRACEDGG